MNDAQMCLFLTSLLRDGRIDVDEYGIEIREFCVNFLWVVEAADVLVTVLMMLMIVVSTIIGLRTGEFISGLVKYDIGRCVCNDKLEYAVKTFFTHHLPRHRPTPHYRI